MRLFKLLTTLAVASALAGCLQSATVVHVKADGSGTIETTTTMSQAALAQMKAMAESFGGKEGAAKGGGFDMFSAEQLKAAAARMGEGVTFVSSEKIKTADAEGAKAVYAFKDVTKLRLSEKPAAGGSGQAGTPSPGGSDPENISFRFARLPDGTSRLTLVSPEMKPGSERPDKQAAEKVNPNDPQFQMIKTMFKGLKIGIDVVVDGRIIKTNSPYVTGNRVTVLEMDFDQLLSDESKLVQMQGINSVEEAKRVLQNVKGFKINTDREVNIDFVGR